TDDVDRYLHVHQLCCARFSCLEITEPQIAAIRCCHIPLLRSFSCCNVNATHRSTTVGASRQCVRRAMSHSSVEVLPAPALRSALEHVAVMQHPVEHRGK